MQSERTTNEAADPRAPTRPIPARAELADETLTLADRETIAEGGAQRVGAERKGPVLAGDAGRRYVFLGELGRGGMGVVYRAFDRDLRRQVAIKVLAAERTARPKALDRFIEEAQLTAQLRHPGIVSVHDIGRTEDDRLFFVMKLVEGRTLRDVARGVHDGRLPEAREYNRFRLVQLLVEVCRAVDYAHRRGVIHRDLKPENVMLGPYGGVQVMDWGLAKAGRGTAPDADGERAADEPAAHDQTSPPAASPPANQAEPPVAPRADRFPTRAGDVFGTPAFMSPEQARGEAGAVDARSDVYSLGATLYYALTGEIAFDGDTTEALLAEVKAGRVMPPRRWAPDLPAELEAICLRAMALRPEDRYAGVGDLADDLQAWLEDRPTTARPPGRLGRLVKLARRNRRASTVAAAALVLGLAGALVGAGLLEGSRRDARASADAARTSAAEAKRRLADYQRFSDAKLLERLVRVWERETPPADARGARALARWVADAEGLLARLPKHEEALLGLRAGALAWSAADRERDRQVHPANATLDELRRMRESAVWAQQQIEQQPEEERNPERLAELEEQLADIDARAEALSRRVESERLTWRFPDDLSQWHHDALAGLVGGVKRLEELGALDDMRARLAFARTIRARSIDEHAEAWSAAVAALADAEASPAYGGLKLRPQVGLVPLGPDPESGLWEFAHLQSGAAAERDEAGRLRVTPETGVVLVLVPGGTFFMGAAPPPPAGSEGPRPANADPLAQAHEQPPHEVTLAPFFVSKLELTQAQWQRAARANPSAVRERPDGELRRAPVPTHPVENISWEASARVLRRLGLELPTEAQWEYAARAGTSTPWHTGRDRSSLRGYANLADRSCREGGGPPTWQYETWLEDGHTVHAPVGSFRPNAFGLHDTAGNVHEWCADTFTPYHRPVREGDGLRDPHARQPHRVFRGGAYCLPAEYARTAYREANTPDFHTGFIGVRPMRRIDR